MTKYYVDVKGMSREEVYKVSEKIRKLFPCLVEGYVDRYYEDLLRYQHHTLCWFEKGNFLYWGDAPEHYDVKYHVTCCRNLGRM